MPPRPTKSGTKKLSEVAKHLAVPEGIKSSGWPQVEKRCAQMGINFDEWQRGAGRLILSKGADGKYAATVGGVGMSLPRQVGKTYLIGAIVFALCVDNPGLTVIWTAHHSRTAGETFLSMQAMSRRRQIAPYVRKVFTAANSEEVRFVNGSRVLFGARDRGFGRGFAGVDILVMDEGQILTDKALDNMLATMNTAPNGLALFMGTPPTPMDPSEAFSRIRADALAGTLTDGVWIECAADDDADPDDRKQWAKANPSYPHRTPASSMLRLRKKLADESWSREGLGIWNSATATSVIDPITWHDRADPASMAVERLSLAVAVSPDRLVSTVAFAGQRADGLWHIEVDEQRSGTAWILEHVTKRCERNEIRAVVIDGASQALSLVDDLQARKIRTTVTGLRDLATACGGLFDAVSEGTVRHIDQPLLNASNGAAGKRAVFSGEAWVWTGKHSALDITPTQAVTLALWGAQNSNVKRPTRKKTGGRRVVTS